MFPWRGSCVWARWNFCPQYLMWKAQKICIQTQRYWGQLWTGNRYAAINWCENPTAVVNFSTCKQASRDCKKRKHPLEPECAPAYGAWKPSERLKSKPLPAFTSILEFVWKVWTFNVEPLNLDMKLNLETLSLNAEPLSEPFIWNLRTCLWNLDLERWKPHLNRYRNSEPLCGTFLMEPCGSWCEASGRQASPLATSSSIGAVLRNRTAH